jgi:hypothetical protein
MTGIRMSMTTTSGRCSRASRTASAPLPASPTPRPRPGRELAAEQTHPLPHTDQTVPAALRSASTSRSAPHTGSTRRWCSAVHVGSAFHPGSPVCSDSAFHSGSAFHNGSTVCSDPAFRSRCAAGSGRGRGDVAVRARAGGTGSVVGDLDGEGVAVLSDADVAAAGAGMADHVGHRLLDDPERRQVDVGRQRGPRAQPPYPHLDAGLRAAGDQAVEVGQARRGIPGRRPGSRVGTPQRAQHPAQRGRGVPAGLLDVGQRDPGLGRLGVDDPAAHPGLDGDDRDAVRHHVVQFPRDPQPLRLHGPSLGLFPLLSGVPAALPDRVTDHPGGHDAQEHDREGARDVTEPADDQRHRDLHADGGQRRRKRHPPRAGGRHLTDHDVDHDGEDDREDPPVGLVDDEEQHGDGSDEHDQERGDRIPADQPQREHQRQGDAGHQQQVGARQSDGKEQREREQERKAPGQRTTRPFLGGRHGADRNDAEITRASARGRKPAGLRWCDPRADVPDAGLPAPS